jgi:hypothetical protein
MQAQGYELTDLLLDKPGPPGLISVPPALVQDRHIEKLKGAAAEQLSPAVAEVLIATEQPYLQVISDIRSNRMAQGRVALMGDAALHCATTRGGGNRESRCRRRADSRQRSRRCRRQRACRTAQVGASQARVQRIAHAAGHRHG